MLLVRVPNWLGDLVMSFDALAGLSSAPGGAGFWAHRRVSGILPVFFPESPVIDSERLPGRGDFDRLLLLTDSFSSAWAGFRSGIPVRIGHGGQFRSPLLTHVLPLPECRGHHHSLDYGKLAGAAGAETVHLEPLRLPEHSPPHIAIFAGAAYGPAKRWTRFAGVAAELSGSTGLEAVFYGSSSEKAHLEGIAREAGDRACVAAGLPLPELCRRLSGAVLAIGNDSGGMHLAAFLGIPSVVLFGSTSPAWTAPSGPRVSILCSGLDCSPCFRPVCSRGEIPPCLEAIDADRVLEAARAVMATGAL